MRAMTDDDMPAVAALVHRLWAHDPVMRQLHDAHAPSLPGAGPGSATGRTLVVAHGGVIVAAGSTFASTLHPTRRFLTIDVDVPQQRRGIGTALLGELRSLGGGTPSLVKARPSDVAWSGFLRRHGFEPLVRTRSGTLDPGRHSAWIVAHLDPPAGVTLEPLRNLLQFARLLATIYRECHGWAPMGPVDDERAMALFGSSLLAETSFIARAPDGESVGGVGLIADPFGGPHAYLVHAGVLACASVDRDRTCRTLVARSLAAAAEQELTVTVEADDTYLTWEPAAELLGPDLVDDIAMWVDG